MAGLDSLPYVQDYKRYIESLINQLLKGFKQSNNAFVGNKIERIIIGQEQQMKRIAYTFYYLLLIYFLSCVIHLIYTDLYRLLTFYGIIEIKRDPFTHGGWPIGGMRYNRLYYFLLMETFAVAILILMLIKKKKVLFLLFSMMAIPTFINALYITIFRLRYHQPPSLYQIAFICTIPLFFGVVGWLKPYLNISWKWTKRDILPVVLGCLLFIGANFLIYRL
jgi:hypothetical protein